MRSVLVLGPSRWAHARGPKWPAVQTSSKRDIAREVARLTPLQLRRELASRLLACEVNAFLFEDWGRKSGESHSQSFLRLIRVTRIKRFLVVWPRQATLLGVDWELGFLASRVESGELDPQLIVLLLESGVLQVDLESGTLSVGEPGNRTRYFEDLITWQCPISTWSTYGQLMRRGIRRALEPLE